MPETPRFSVIVPAYNVEAFVGEAIESVLRQSVSDWELIIVDDGSTDATASIVHRFTDPRIHFIRQENAGVSAARNRGIAAARGAYFAFLDADDRLRPTALERLSAGFEGAPEACVAYGNGSIISASGKAFGADARAVFGLRPSGYVLPVLLARNFIRNGGALLVRARCLASAGAFRVAIRMGEDWEMWCRLAALGDFVFIGHEPVMEYRIRPGSAGRVAGSSLDQHWPAIDAAFANPQITCLFTTRELNRLRRKRESDAYCFVGTEAIRARDWRLARQMFIESLRRWHMNPRVLIRLVCTILRWIPPPVARRIGY